MYSIPDNRLQRRYLIYALPGSLLAQPFGSVIELTIDLYIVIELTIDLYIDQ